MPDAEVYHTIVTVSTFMPELSISITVVTNSDLSTRGNSRHANVLVLPVGVYSCFATRHL